MKNQIQSLQTILFLLLFVLGLNAFTRTKRNDPISYDIMEGKINATENAKNYTSYQKAQQTFAQMKAQFEKLARDQESNGESLPQLSMLSQILYVYEYQMNMTIHPNKDAEKTKELDDKLEQIKNEFYQALGRLNY